MSSRTELRKEKKKTKQVLRSTHMENEALKIRGSSENVNRLKMETCNSTGKIR